MQEIKSTLIEIDIPNYIRSYSITEKDIIVHKNGKRFIVHSILSNTQLLLISNEGTYHTMDYNTTSASDYKIQVWIVRSKDLPKPYYTQENLPFKTEE